MLKYALMPGFVYSKTDDQRHYINAYTLAKLYGVSPLECEIFEPDPLWPLHIFKHQYDVIVKGKIALYPNYEGDYSLPTKVME